MSTTYKDRPGRVGLSWIQAPQRAPNTGLWYNGITSVSKTADRGSIPWSPAKQLYLIIDRKYNNSMYKVYYTVDDTPHAEVFEDMSVALSATQFHRSLGRTFVTMVSENPNSIGKPGVDAVVNGKTPDGEDYTWMKRRTQ